MQGKIRLLEHITKNSIARREKSNSKFTLGYVEQNLEFVTNFPKFKIANITNQLPSSVTI